MTAPNFQTGGQHRLYVGVEALTGANKGQPKFVTNFADGTDLSGGTGLTDGINDMHTAGQLVPTLNVKDLNEDSSETKVDVSTRADSVQGITAEFITTTTNGFNYQMNYKANDPAGATLLDAYADPVFRALLLAKTTVSEIFAIDCDGFLDFVTPLNNHGIMGQAGNWTLTLSKAKPVAGVITMTATFAQSSFGELVVYDGVGAQWVRYA